MLRKTLDHLPYSRPYLMVTGIGLLLFYPTWLRLLERWLAFDQVLAHGLFTAIIFIGLILIHPPRQTSPKGQFNGNQWLSIPFFFMTVLIWSILELVRIDTLAFLMLPVGLLSLSWIFLGRPATKAFFPYVFLLSLSLPIWADLVPFLVKFASIVVNKSVNLFGMTVLVEGNSISLPYGRLVIADGCSGIRYFAISILLASMVSILNDSRLKAWILALAFAATLALIVNWVRIIILVIVAYASDMQSGLLTDHETMGWLVFAVVALPALYFSPAHWRKNTDEILRAALRTKAFIPLSLAIALGPIGLSYARAQIDLSKQWQMTGETFTLENHDAMPLPLELPETMNQKTWRLDQTWLSLAYPSQDGDDKKLVPYLGKLVDPETWHRTDSGTNGVILYKNILNRTQVAISLQYQVGQFRTDRYWAAKLLQIPAILTGNAHFALLLIQRECELRDCAQAIGKVATLKNGLSITRNNNQISVAFRQ